MATLKYIGPRLSTGEPERSLNYDGIPTGDLDSDHLTKEQLKIVRKSGLYEEKPEPASKQSKPEPADSGEGE